MDLKQLQEQINTLEANVAAILRIYQLTYRSTATGEERFPVSMANGDGTYTDYQMDLEAVLKNRTTEKEADYPATLADRNSTIIFKGNDLTYTIPDDLGWAKGDIQKIVARGTGFSFDTSAVTLEKPQDFEDVENSSFYMQKVDRVADKDVYNIVQIGQSSGGSVASDITNRFDRLNDIGDASGTINLDMTAYETFNISLTGTATLALTNTPSTGFSKTITVNITGDETLNLPGGWNVVGTYDGTVDNKIVVQYVKSGVIDASINPTS